MSSSTQSSTDRRTDSKNVTVVMPPQLYERLVEAAAKAGLSRSRYIAKLVTDVVGGEEFLRPPHNPNWVPVEAEGNMSGD